MTPSNVGPRAHPSSEIVTRESLWTTAEAAKYLAVSESWLLRSGIPFIRLARLRRYHPEVVRAYLNARASSKAFLAVVS